MKFVRSIPIVTWLLFTMLNAHAQNNKIDSIKTLISKAAEDTVKVDLMVDLGKRLFGSNPTESMEISIEALDLATKLNYKKGEAYVLKNIGLAYYTQGKYADVLQYWQQSLAMFESIGDKLGESNLLNNIGAVYFNQGDDDQAIGFYLKSLKVSEQIGDKLRIATALSNIGAVYFNKTSTHDKALGYYLEALKVSGESGDLEAVGTSSVNIGEIYFTRGDDQSALMYFQKSLDAYRKSSGNIPYTLNNIGKVYARQGKFTQAIQYQTEALETAKKTDSKLEMTRSLLGLAHTYRQQKSQSLALSNFHKAEAIAQEIGSSNELKDSYDGLSQLYSQLNDFKNAYHYQQLLTSIKDTLYNAESAKRIASLQLNFDIEKKQAQIDLLTKDKALQQLDLQNQKFVRNALFLGVGLIAVIAFILYRSNTVKVKINHLLTQRNEKISAQKEEIATQRDNLDKQKEEIENLLLNILPAETAQELQKNGVATPRYYESVTVMFTDFKDFTVIAGKLSAQELVAQLNQTFVAFDEIIIQHRLEKIKTVGDAYMCAGGIPTEDNEHFINTIRAGLDILEYMRIENEKRVAQNTMPWHVRVGIHTGPVVAGVVGKKKFAYDIWGDTVNIASRMETNGEPGKVNISSTTYELVKDQYVCFYRGKIQAKNIGEVDMYFIEQEI